MGNTQSVQLRELLWEWIEWEEGTTNRPPMCMHLDNPTGYGSEVCWTGPRYTNELLKNRISRLEEEKEELEKNI